MIANTTAGKKIAGSSKICNSVAMKALGLMFSRKKQDFGLIFRFNSENIRPLHMFFVFYSIDILFLDKSNKVIEIKRNFKPFTAYIPKKPSQYIIELPAGSTTDCSIGDKITFK